MYSYEWHYLCQGNIFIICPSFLFPHVQFTYPDRYTFIHARARFVVLCFGLALVKQPWNIQVNMAHQSMLTYCQLNPKKQTSVKFKFKFKYFRSMFSKMSSEKWRPFLSQPQSVNPHTGVARSFLWNTNWLESVCKPTAGTAIGMSFNSWKICNSSS